MDESKAIELLRQALTEIPNLKELHYDNQKFKLWCNRVETIIKYGLDEDDYNTFESVQSLYFLDDIVDIGIEQSEDYPKKLKDYETALLSIIKKYEMLGIETEPEAKVEPPDVIKDFEEKAGKELELTLTGTPDTILECIRSTIEKLNSQGYTYSFHRTSGAPDYSRWDKTQFASCAISQGNEGQIGIIKLQFLSNEKTLLKSQEPEDWHSSFGYFLNSLLAELQVPGFADSKRQKPAVKAGIPKAFIAHGGDSPALAKLKSFLEALGVQPIIVEEQPSEGRSIAENVDWYSRQADCAIILATKGDVDARTGGFIPRGNVLMETGKLQEIFKDRIVYLLQAGTKFPTNISEKVRERFTSQNMDNAFIKIAKELKKFGILRAVKPQPKEQKP